MKYLNLLRKILDFSIVKGDMMIGTNSGNFDIFHAPADGTAFVYDSTQTDGVKGGTLADINVGNAATVRSNLGITNLYNPSSVAITGGTIDGTTLGATTASSARLTTLQITEGTNAKMGTATLALGTVTVTNTSVTANSRIFLTAQSSSSVGVLRVTAKTAGTSFVITSSVLTDSGVVDWLIIEPA